MDAPWDPSFFRRSNLFWPITRAATALERFEAWPEPADLACVFEGEGPVRFVSAAPRRRRERTTASARYDALITESRTVPTRRRCWHDLLNALVWASFPRAKAALHARQYRLISGRIGQDARLPGARTREQDAIAMLDEGGVVTFGAPGEAGETVVFGHAIYETLVCKGWVDMRAAGYTVPGGAADAPRSSLVSRADEALARLLSHDEPVDRSALGTATVRARLHASPL